jgi:hypothetical protein
MRAFDCINKVASIYYEHLKPYMNHLFEVRSACVAVLCVGRGGGCCETVPAVCCCS